MRPGIAMKVRLNGVRRHLSTLNYHGRKGNTVFESFPSGDVAGAMVFGGVVYEHEFGISFLCICLDVALGRMYFWAHHLFDVSVGALIAAVCCTILIPLSDGKILTFISRCYRCSLIAVRKMTALVLVIYEKVSREKVSGQGKGENRTMAGPC